MYENIPYPEAVKRLGARVNIRVEDEPLSPEQNAEHQQRQRLLALHAGAAEWFHTNLLRTKAAQTARDYLKSRGLTSDTAKNWKLGYAPNAWDAFGYWAREKGFSDGELIASGLVTFKEEEKSGRSSHYYDRFRDRLMFPICNGFGEVIAFSSRVLNAEAFGGKYVNSPETPLFTKGKVLFGLHKSKRALIDKTPPSFAKGKSTSSPLSKPVFRMSLPRRARHLRENRRKSSSDTPAK
jgi:DNA primase